MDKFPLLWDGRPSGELTTEQEALYTWFTARCRLPEEGLWCAWAVGDLGELRLGVLEPEGERGVIRRRFSRRMTAPLGQLLRGELRPAMERAAQEKWGPAPEPGNLFHASWLRQRMRGLQGALTRTEGGCRYVALPYDEEKRFPVTTLFCFARIQCIDGGTYVVYAFDAQESPVFR